ncbi:MAG TPA: zeta toxin family protein [Candidatus Sulfotelmatobacter sp.]|nr:zeta toxin family protein [Candidatus Sulfotelmatobacter sp.]
MDKRPIIVVLAGHNGAGKSTFYHAHLEVSGLRFLNADVLAAELDVNPYLASEATARLRQELVKQGESFIFETVFSDPVGDKLAFLKSALEHGYHVLLCFIGLSSPALAEQRVAMRVSQGGHDVPTAKLVARFPRTLANLAAAIRSLPCVLVFDNDDLRKPFRRVAVFQNGKQTFSAKTAPAWFKALKF